jgi:hypothetical protein
MTTLYEMTNEYLNLLTMIDTEDGEVTPDIMLAINAIDEQVATKVENICKLINSAKATAECCRLESARLADRKRRLENFQKQAKSWIMEHMVLTGEVKVQTPLFTVSRCKSPESIEVTDMDLIPTDFDREQKREVDRSMLLKALKEGRFVPGCDIVQGEHIRIK